MNSCFPNSVHGIGPFSHMRWFTVKLKLNIASCNFLSFRTAWNSQRLPNFSYVFDDTSVSFFGGYSILCNETDPLEKKILLIQTHRSNVLQRSSNPWNAGLGITIEACKHANLQNFIAMKTAQRTISIARNKNMLRNRQPPITTKSSTTEQKESRRALLIRTGKAKLLVERIEPLIFASGNCLAPRYHVD